MSDLKAVHELTSNPGTAESFNYSVYDIKGIALIQTHAGSEVYKCLKKFQGYSPVTESVCIFTLHWDARCNGKRNCKDSSGIQIQARGNNSFEISAPFATRT